jgi:hypothetical protein
MTTRKRKRKVEPPRQQKPRNERLMIDPNCVYAGRYDHIYHNNLLLYLEYEKEKAHEP